MRAAAWLRSGFVRLSDEGLRRLRPAIAEAITSPQPVSASHALDDDDARTLERARAASARWRDHVDRVPPAELLDIVLNDSAYAFEMRGPRFRQARENVKKIRGMVRRVQNRGYATVARVVSHLDRLAIGDEANAATDAAGSVSLMTVHAAKGLEFPVVFIVNLTRGTGGVPSPIRLASGEDDDLSVSIGEFRSGLDEDEAAIELEETKRLLYVALTRARDRLYLSAVVRDGLMKHGRGSLAEALPASLRAVLAAAAGASAEWQASSGAVHGFRVCAVPTAGQAERERSAAVVPAPTELERDYAPLPGTDDPLPVTWAGASGLDPFPRQRVRSETADLLCGRLVHRLIERLGFPQQGADLPDLAERARLLIEKEDAAETTQMNQAVLEACRIYRGLTGRRDLRALFEGGEAFYEVPFVAGSDEGMVRGTIDCIIRRPSAGPSSSGDRITVLEFKTGRPRQEHHGQALFYKQAAERVFPGAVVEAWVVYPEQLVSC
jgi:ATP-dependent helicase/nuclease subunit A